jgi:glyceraldehyde-3-phosphate dehydrogenase (NAD(P))
MDKIKVGVVGYGTIGKRVADLVRLQKDMDLVGVTGHSYNWRMETANDKGIPIYTMDGIEDFKTNDIKVAGNVKDLLKEVDIVVDGTPKKIGKEHLDTYYKPAKVKAIFQGGEKPEVAETSFVAQCNYDEALGKDYIRVVSCNTTGLCRTLHALDKVYKIEGVHATMVRRGADPGDIKHGPINGVVPVLELPSHHGPDVRTVLPSMDIFTTAMSVSSTLMHVHSIIADIKEEADVKEMAKILRATTRVRVVRNAEKVRSTAEIMELGKDLGNFRGDMPEICVWEEALGTYKNKEYNKLLYLQAVHQESDVVLENIDAIRAAMGFTDGAKSIKLTNVSYGLEK